MSEATHDARSGAPEKTSSGERRDELMRCSRCGRLDAEHVFEDFVLCTDCCYLYGSCCLELGSDDLWKA